MDRVICNSLSPDKQKTQSIQTFTSKFLVVPNFSLKKSLVPRPLVQVFVVWCCSHQFGLVGTSKYSCAEPQSLCACFMCLGRVKSPRKGCCWKLKMLHLLGTLWVSYREENHFSWDLIREPPDSSRCCLHRRD